MTKDLYTFGYEGLSLDVFIGRLKSAGVERVIDVRATPLSRKRGFSKNGLSVALANAGIAYTHSAAMGCPKPVRDRYKQDSNWTTYTQGFLSYLSENSEALAEVAQIAKGSRSCLICFEADYNRCHRTYVARGAAQLANFRVKHITAESTVDDGAALSGV